MTEDEGGRGTDLGTVIRGLRRSADLSQRQLATRSGVPQTTIARIESGATRDPAWHTVERLVHTLGARVSVTREREQPPLPEVPHDDWRDAAGRRYPAHLDAVEVTHPGQWSGAWWVSSVMPSAWPLEDVPAVTFDLSRPRRDERRRRLARGAAATVRRAVDGPGVAYVAELVDGTRVGGLSGHPFSADADDHLLAPGMGAAPGTVVLDGVLVRRDWRRLGVGRRMVEALVGDASGPVTVMAFSFGHRRFFEACGFRPTRCLATPGWYARVGT